MLFFSNPDLGSLPRPDLRCPKSGCFSSGENLPALHLLSLAHWTPALSAYRRLHLDTGRSLFYRIAPSPQITTIFCLVGKIIFEVLHRTNQLPDSSGLAKMIVFLVIVFER
jgi:hypothetical protein